MPNNKNEFEKVTYKNKKDTVNSEIELKNLQRRIHSPKVDLIERDQYYLVRIELPGVTQDSIKIQIKEQQIVFISGFKNKEDIHDTDRIIYKESKYNNFTRRIKLPSSIKFFNLNQKLNFVNGILYLQFEKTSNLNTNENTNQNTSENTNENTTENINENTQDTLQENFSIDLNKKIDWSEL